MAALPGQQGEGGDRRFRGGRIKRPSHGERAAGHRPGGQRRRTYGCRGTRNRHRRADSGPRGGGFRPGGPGAGGRDPAGPGLRQRTARRHLGRKGTRRGPHRQGHRLGRRPRGEGDSRGPVLPHGSARVEGRGGARRCFGGAGGGLSGQRPSGSAEQDRGSQGAALPGGLSPGVVGHGRGRQRGPVGFSAPRRTRRGGGPRVAGAEHLLRRRRLHVRREPADDLLRHRIRGGNRGSGGGQVPG